MLDYIELEKEILWVLENYGSPAQERKQPGSRAKTQARRVTEFIRQYNEVETFLYNNKLDLIGIKRVKA